MFGKTYRKLDFSGGQQGSLFQRDIAPGLRAVRLFVLFQWNFAPGLRALRLFVLFQWNFAPLVSER